MLKATSIECPAQALTRHIEKLDTQSVVPAYLSKGLLQHPTASDNALARIVI
jgi:hypothetical protein